MKEILQNSSKSYAKINLALGIVGKRKDGYHLLSTIMQSISLADDIAIKFYLGKARVWIHCQGLNLEMQDNLVYKAAIAWLQETQADLDLEINLVKKIPSQAGLGGASTNAATTLRLLNQYQEIEPQRLLEIASLLGADVPFCLFGGTAYCTGIGEEIETMPAWHNDAILVLSPPLQICTSKAFAQVKKITAKYISPRLIKNLQSKQVQELKTEFFNSFLPLAFKLEPELEGYYQALIQTKAQLVQMTGSGPSLFAIYANRAEAKQAQTALAAKLPNSKIFLCRTISADEYNDQLGNAKQS